MASTLAARLYKLESAVPGADKPYPRVIQIVSNNRDEADELARANGFHPGEDGYNEIIINRILVSPPGKVHEPIKPYVIDRAS
ncbi:hypothetical protein [Mesorhizobium sp. KR9-304]|uniref:hypothetical protein n=1 Tax=Mesorhizobium sp. KR9-304 TaxID=3156614 RepID=UPI0032B4A677